MKRVELSVDINAKASDIWQVLTTPARFTDWIKGIQSVELLTEGDYGVGTRFRILAGAGAGSVQWTVEITGLQTERSIDFRFTGDVEGIGGWRIQPLADDVAYRVTSFDEFVPAGGWLLKLLSRLLPDKAARSSRRESLLELKAILEDE